MTNDIRVRIAPSPTGNLHVGTARTALFNYLFAKHNNGKFILRIEDTDLERSKSEYTQNIYDSLKAMGLNWDEGPDVGGEYGPYTQSERLESYANYAKQLTESGHAYECWCTQEELDAEKESAIAEKRAYIYSGRCKNLTPEQVEQYKAEGRKSTLRFAMPSKQIAFKDLSKGDLSFDTSLIGDFVIMKSSGTPTYNFAVVIDDMEMKMSHVIRGEDHISNTPRQIAIYEALGAKVPQFAHVGMILAPDKSKLSKRHGATAVSEFIEQGYLPEAFVNFITLLGWSPEDGQEIKSIQEIADMFTIERVSPSPAVFEFDKLNWMNGQYIRSMDISELTNRVKKYLDKYDLSEYSQEKLEMIVGAVREPLVKLNEITDAVEYFFGTDVNYNDKAKEVLAEDVSKSVLSEFVEISQGFDYENSETLHDQLAELRNKFKEQGIKPKQTMWAVRSALTGTLQGADLAMTIQILGKDRVKARTELALNKAGA